MPVLGRLFCRDHRGQGQRVVPAWRLAHNTQLSWRIWPGGQDLYCALAALAEAAKLRTPGAMYCICIQRIIFTEIMRSMQGQYSRVQMTSLGVGTSKNRRYQ
jgi:hypothetical protein